MVRLKEGRERITAETNPAQKRTMMEGVFDDLQRDYPGGMANNFAHIRDFFLKQCEYDPDRLMSLLRNDEKMNFDREIRKREELDGFDKQYGTRTSLILEHFELNETVPIERLLNSSRFAPSPIKGFRFALQQLADFRVDYSKYTFIDIGVGLGRNLLLASEFPFKRIIGVEISEQLCAIAQENIEQYNNTSGRVCPAEVVCSDALSYSFPPGPLVLYFWEPFSGVTQTAFVKHLEAYLEASGQSIMLVFMGGVFRDIIRSDKFKMLGVRDTTEYSGNGTFFRVTIFGPAVDPEETIYYI